MPVLVASGFMVFVEFFADKIPWVDSLWDAVHTLVRIPAGAALAAAVFGGQGTPAVIAGAILGGTLAAGSHFTKAGTRAAINTSPEPFTNWTASLAEDAAVLGAIWLAFAHPVAFLVLFALFLAFLAWLVPKLWRLAAAVFRRLRREPGRSAT
jgi:hypothetical protein